MTFLFPKSICRFLRRHRSKFIFTGVFVGGVYGVIKLVEYKIKEHFEKEQKRAGKELVLQKNFEQVQHHCFTIAESMLGDICEKVKQAANTEEIIKKLKSGDGEKLMLWSDLKSMVFCQIATGLYSVVIVSLILQVQINQIAGLMFNTPSKDDNSFESRQQKFLSITHDHLMQHGIHDLATYIRKVAISQTQIIPLQSMVNYNDLETTLRNICTQLFTETSGGSSGKSLVKFMKFAFPDNMGLEDWTFVPPSEQDDVEAWTAKTIDIVDSPDFETVLSDCVSKGIALIGNDLNNAMSQNVANSSQSSIVELQTVPLAKALPILNCRLSTVCSSRFLKDILSCSMLNQFSMNVYDSFLQT